MKKIIIAFVLLVCSSSLFAQNVDSYGIPVNSLNIQASDALVPTVTASLGMALGIAMGGAIAAVISGGQAEIDAPKTTGWFPYISAGWEHHFPESRWSLGPELGYWQYGLVSSTSAQYLHLMTLSAASKLYYKRSGTCKLYGGVNLGIGTAFSTVRTLSAASVATKADDTAGDGSSSDTGSNGGPSFFPAVQLNPIGMRLGSEKVAFVAELGIGYKGILQLGMNIAL